MATYLKRTSKLFDLSLRQGGQGSANVNLRDLMCPVCRGILIEPVTLPCTHNLCLRCLKGTFEHNSLSCPLCRVRVGSWLRTATKSETLVNTGLWELIRSKFPKEVEDKFNGDDADIDLNSGFTTANKILSAAGEIRREYEAQLQMAEQEIRLQREAAELASQALIRKIQEEEQQKIVQLAKDQLLAKTLVKKEISAKQKDSDKYYNECLNMSLRNHSLESQNANVKLKRSSQTDASKSESTGLESERFASNLKASAPNTMKESAKLCCPKSVTVYNTITKTVKHQNVSQPSTSGYTVDGCSSSKVYGTQSKEELNVPSDVLNCKGKSLGVEVCVNLIDDDERTGSAESAGSHDSINQEIHHFKPIKAMPRTPLKISSDGRQIDPKLIRVVPIMKRVFNPVPKSLSVTHVKKMIGCSWSAFRGKIRQKLEVAGNLQSIKIMEDQRSPLLAMQCNLTVNKSSKSINDATRRIESVQEVSCDNNKNYTKNTNKTINGTKLNKNRYVKNGMIAKYRQQKHICLNKKGVDFVKETIADDSRSSASSSSLKPSSPCEESLQELKDVVENIAERIKKRKISSDKKTLHRLHNIHIDTEIEVARRSTKKLVISEEGDARDEIEENKDDTDAPIVTKKGVKRKISSKTILKGKGRAVGKIRNTHPDLLKSTKVEDVRLRKSTRNAKSEVKRSKNLRNNDMCQYSSDSYHNSSENISFRLSDKVSFSDEEVIKEQRRIEKLVMQEKEDFELAQRLQAKYDEMERVAGRTRRCTRAIATGTTELDSFKYDVTRKSNKMTGDHSGKSAMDQSMNSETKRGRPQKRMLK
ncbi:E3 ubiquitin-protein ligase rnf168-like isoform X2 [Prorops nasuta]|uniref:E3 ubiquitin-protein ligase rnf168-like isoform X2 n=1 Tax=Prorops nasuta TaxID=863751 RepID=UPI0034CDAAFA